MKRTKVLLSVLAVICAVLFLGFSLGEARFAARAELTQRVLPSEEASLFGDVGEKVGSPQRLIVDDPKAILPERGADGVRLVNEQYLRDNGIYPLQMQTVSYVASTGRAVSAVLFAVLLAGLLWVRRRSNVS